MFWWSFLFVIFEQDIAAWRTAEHEYENRVVSLRLLLKQKTESERFGTAPVTKKEK